MTAANGCEAEWFIVDVQYDYNADEDLLTSVADVKGYGAIVDDQFDDNADWDPYAGDAHIGEASHPGPAGSRRSKRIKKQKGGKATPTPPSRPFDFSNVQSMLMSILEPMLRAALAQLIGGHGGLSGLANLASNVTRENAAPAPARKKPNDKDKKVKVKGRGKGG
eukprot:5547170-Heterocapsa_arctica.AAC.1